MPFTLSHPLAVLPLRRSGLPVSALVAGSMVPDLPLFARSGRGYALSHSFVGVVTLDVVMTMAVLGLWFALVRDAVVDLSPAAVRSRLPAHVRIAPRTWLLAVPAAAIGALTHVVWDAFTHAGRWGVDAIGWLQRDHLGIAGSRWAQDVSSLVGLVVLCAAALSFLRSRPPSRTTPAHPRWARALLPAVPLVGVLTLVGTVLLRPDLDARTAVVVGLIDAIPAALLALVGVGLLWRLLVDRR